MKPLYQESSFVVPSIEFNKFCIVTGYGAIVKTFVMLLSSSFKMVSDKLFFCIHSTNTTINANMAARFFVLIANIAAMTSHVLTSCRLEMSSNKTSYTENNAKTMATFFCGFIV